MTPPAPTAHPAPAPTLVELAVGRRVWPLAVRPGALVGLTRASDPGAAAGTPGELVRAALENPVGVGAPMRRAVTPDDRVAVVFDESLPHAAELLAGVVEHLQSAGVAPENVTVVTPAGSGAAAWVDDLPDEFSDVRLEVHDLEDRAKLAYLATTKAGKRVYLSRTLVEADFVVALTGRRYDPTFGYAGAEAAVFPALGEPEAVAALVGQFTLKAPGVKPRPARAEAAEVLRLLGSPFLVHVIEGAGDGVREVVATLYDRSADGAARQDAVWRVTAADRADLVVAAVSGDPARVTFLDLARAASEAAKAVRPGGRVAVVTDAAPALQEGAELIRRADDADEVPDVLKIRKPDDWPAAALWLSAVRNTNVFLASRLDDEAAEALFATPLQSAAELQRLADVAERVLVIPDAHKVVVEVA